jgi:SHS2 domain-containing protein
MSEQNFEVIEHTADWSIRVKGHDLLELFKHAAEGLSTLMAGDLDALPQDVEHSLELAAHDVESLLVDWLSELAYWAEMEQIVFCCFDMLEVTQTNLSAVVRGGLAEELHKHIKAVTYHNLKVIQGAKGWETTIVFDV